MKEKIKSLLIDRSSTIKEAMSRISQGGLRIALVVDDNKKLTGVVTDGDIRRALLSEKNLDNSINNIIAKDPVKADEKTPVDELLNLMIDKGLQQIPIVDSEGTILDIVLLSDLKSIPLSNPDITHKEIDIIKQVLSSSFLSIGPKIKEFENKVKDYIGTRYAIAVNSGTSALHLCVRSLGIKEGDEIITTPFSFIASANCALFEEARPVFVDIDKNNLCIDSEKIEEKITDKTKAILPVHIFGYPCNMDKITEIANKYNLAIIEDACEAIGTEYKDKKVGSFGDVGVFAFYPNKQITTAEGGMVVTNDKNIAELCRSMRNQGRDENVSWLSHKRLGYNYRMSELSAALGVVQIERVEEILQKRQKVANFYNQRLKNNPYIEIPYLDDSVKMSWFVYVVRLSKKYFTQKDRGKIMQTLRERGISCRNYFPPIHLEPLYTKQFGYKKGDFPITEKISELTIALPFFNDLDKSEINYICDNLEEVAQGYLRR